MGEKVSVLVKYKYLEYIQAARLSKADSWDLIEAIIEYDKSEKEPVFENPVLTGIFTVIKIDLNENKKKWEKVVEERKNAGKAGAEKRKQNRQMQAKQANADFAEKNGQGQANLAKQAEYEFESESEFDSDNEFEKEREESLSGDFSVDDESNQHPDISETAGLPEKNYAVIFEKVKAKWKEVIGQETRDTLLTVPLPKREKFINTLANYSLEEIFNAIGNYHTARSHPEKYDIGGRTYGTLYGFLESGVSQFFQDEIAVKNFRRKKSDK
jgi:hypothetical protein